MEAGLAEDVISGGITAGRCLNLELEQGSVPAGAETGSVEPWTQWAGAQPGLGCPTGFCVFGPSTAYLPSGTSPIICSFVDSADVC